MLVYYALPAISLLFVIPCLWSMFRRTGLIGHLGKKAIIAVLVAFAVVMVREMWWALKDTPFCNAYRNVCALIVIATSIGVCKLARQADR